MSRQIVTLAVAGLRLACISLIYAAPIASADIGKQDLVGRWQQVGTSMTPSSDRSEFERVGVNVSYEFKSDGKVIYTSAGQRHSYEYSLAGEKLVIRNDERRVFAYELHSVGDNELVWRSAIGSYVLFHRN